MSAEQLWDLHGTSLYALACGLLGDEPAAVRAVTRGMTDFIIQTESDPGLEKSDVLPQLSGYVYQRCELMVADVSFSRTMTMPPLIVWLSELVRVQRACLALCVFGGHTHREAAKRLNLSPVTVAGMLTAGLHQIAARASGNGQAASQYDRSTVSGGRF